MTFIREVTTFENAVREEQPIERINRLPIDVIADFAEQQTENYSTLYRSLPDAFRERRLPVQEIADFYDQQINDMGELYRDLGDLSRDNFEDYLDRQRLDDYRYDDFLDRNYLTDLIDLWKDLIFNPPLGRASNGGQPGNTWPPPPPPPGLPPTPPDQCFRYRGHCTPSYIEIIAYKNYAYIEVYTPQDGSGYTIRDEAFSDGFYRVFLQGSSAFPELYDRNRGDLPAINEIGYIPIPDQVCPGGVYLWTETETVPTIVNDPGFEVNLINTKVTLYMTYGNRTVAHTVTSDLNGYTFSDFGLSTLLRTSSASSGFQYRLVFEPPCEPRYPDYPEPPPEPPDEEPPMECDCTAISSMLKQILSILGSEEWFSSGEDVTASMKMNPEAKIESLINQIYPSNSPDGKEVQIKSLHGLLLATNAVSHRRSGFDRLPAKLPESLTDPNKEGQITIADLVSINQWMITQLDAILGQYPIELKYKNAQGETKELSLDNQAEVQAEVLGLMLSMSADVDVLIEMGMKSIVEAIKAGNSAIQASDYAKANAEFLGYKSRQRAGNIPLTISPGKKSLAESLRESNQKMSRFEFDDTDDLQDTLKRILISTEIIKAVFSRPFDTNNPFIPGDAIRQDINNSNSEEDQAWSQFIAAIENPIGQQQRDEGTPNPDLKDLTVNDS